MSQHPKTYEVEAVVTVLAHCEECAIYATTRTIHRVAPTPDATILSVEVLEDAVTELETMSRDDYRLDNAPDGSN